MLILGKSSKLGGEGLRDDLSFLNTICLGLIRGGLIFGSILDVFLVSKLVAKLKVYLTLLGDY